MFNVTIGSCPYENWTSVARASCDNPDHFHCLKDEYGRLGWVCTEPIWVEENRCPVFNVVAKKLDSIDCPIKRCPPYTYRSNEINVEYACRYASNNGSFTQPVPVPSDNFKLPSDSNNLLPVLITIVILAIFATMTGIIMIYIHHEMTRKKVISRGRSLETSLKCVTTKRLNNTSGSIKRKGSVALRPGEKIREI